MLQSQLPRGTGIPRDHARGMWRDWQNRVTRYTGLTPLKKPGEGPAVALAAQGPGGR